MVERKVVGTKILFLSFWKIDSVVLKEKSGMNSSHIFSDSFCKVSKNGDVKEILLIKREGGNTVMSLFGSSAASP